MHLKIKAVKIPIKTPNLIDMFSALQRLIVTTIATYNAMKNRGNPTEKTEVREYFNWFGKPCHIISSNRKKVSIEGDNK